ncbi:hypothetical protein [uncultured Bartonella sp.]|nr:hypothetical protein [uncultured Bartonella sp.]
MTIFNPSTGGSLCHFELDKQTMPLSNFTAPSKLAEEWSAEN